MASAAVKWSRAGSRAVPREDSDIIDVNACKSLHQGRMASRWNSFSEASSKCMALCCDPLETRHEDRVD